GRGTLTFVATRMSRILLCVDFCAGGTGHNKTAPKTALRPVQSSRFGEEGTRHQAIGNSRIFWTLDRQNPSPIQSFQPFNRFAKLKPHMKATGKRASARVNGSKVQGPGRQILKPLEAETSTISHGSRSVSCKA